MYTVVISIGVAPHNFERREALRRTWLSWARDQQDVKYVFFTEMPEKGHKRFAADTREKLQQEQEKNKDMVFQEGPTGYGKNNGMREVVHIQYYMQRNRFKYYLRVDDDGFLCLQQLLEELRWYMPQYTELLHGKYHCHSAKARMDENYLLMSYGAAKVVAEAFATDRVPWNPALTFALSLGNIVPLLQRAINLHVFDDGERFCWQVSVSVNIITGELNPRQKDLEGGGK